MANPPQTAPWGHPSAAMARALLWDTYPRADRRIWRGRPVARELVAGTFGAPNPRPWGATVVIRCYRLALVATTA